MTLTIAVIFELLALIAFVAAAVGVPSRVNLIAVGLALFMFSLLIT
jgi:hypothetical protein